MSCGCQNAYCKHAWEALSPEDLESDDFVYAFVNKAATEHMKYMNQVIFNDPTGKPARVLPLSAAGFTLPVFTLPVVGLGYWVTPTGMTKDEIWATLRDINHTTKEMNWRTPGHLEFTTGNAARILMGDSWYYPWGAPRKEEPETVLPPTCQHKWVDVGVMHPKIVCYHCDIEKPAIDTPQGL